MYNAMVLLLSLLIPQSFMGLYAVEEITPAISNSVQNGAQNITITGSEPTIERMLWTLNVIYPVKDYTNTTSHYGWRDVHGCKKCSDFHKGLDFVPGAGSEVYAIMDELD